MNYNIDEFWRARLLARSVRSDSLVKGWYQDVPELVTFTEAPLKLSENFGDPVDPKLESLIFISAPGTVGKSTLARQLSAVTGAIYIDLAEADPVGANTLSGGLARSNLYASWQSGNCAVLIDGLDEARLRVTQEAFEAFLSDVAFMS